MNDREDLRIDEAIADVGVDFVSRSTRSNGSGLEYGCLLCVFAAPADSESAANHRASKRHADALEAYERGRAAIAATLRKEEETDG